VVLETDTRKTSPNEPDSTCFAAAFTSLVMVAVVAARNKGRLKVPAEFKRVIDEKYAQRFYITSLDGVIAQIYPFEEWERIEQKLAQLSTYNPTKKKFLTRTNYYGQVVEMDGQGRLLIPQTLREAAQIRGDVAVLGNLTYLEVRNMEALDKEIKEPFTDEDTKTLDDLGI
jgi:MraZ protein